MTDNPNIRERITALYDIAYDTNNAIKDIKGVIFGNAPEIEPGQTGYGLSNVLLNDIEVLYEVLAQNLKSLEEIRKTI